MTQPNLSNILHPLQLAKRLLALFAALSFLAASDAQAGQRIWNGSGTDGLWTNSTNWGGAAPDGNDNFLLAGTTRLTNTNNLAVNNTANVNTFLVFSNTAGAFVLFGTNNTADALILTSAGAMTNLSTSTQTINFGMTFRSTTGTNSVNTASGSIILNGIIAGTNITKSGAATLFLNGANTFSGVLSNSAGAIRVGNNNGLGTTNSNTVIVSGAALELSTNSAGGNLSIGAEALSLAGTGINSAGALRNITGSNSYGGLLTITNATRINSDADTLTLTNTGTITGATFGLTFGGAGNLTINSIIGTTTGTVTKDGAGTLILGAANTYTGDTIVGAGVLRLSGSGSIDAASGVVVSNGATFDLNSISDTVDGVSGAGTVTLGSATLTVSNSATNNFSGTLSGSGGLIKVGAGTQIVSGTANSYGGTTTIGAGVLNVGTLANAGQNSSIGTNGTIIITNGGVLQYGGSTVSIDRNINLASGTGVIGVTNTATSLTIAGVISNSGSLVKTNGGTLILSGANTYSNTTTVGAGVLNIQNSAGLGATNNGTTVVSGAALELQGGITVGAEALTLNGTGISSGGALRNVAGTNIYGGAITLGSASTISADAGSTLQLTNTIGGNFGKTFSADGAITASRVISGSGGLTKIGTGTLTLGATNTFTGGISLFGGTLSVASSNNLGANTVTITNRATFSITDSSTTLTNSFVLTNGGATVFVAGGNTFWSGPITGGGGLVKEGGDLILSGAGKTNNIGAIGVQGGRLFVSDSLSNIAGSAITVSNAATLAFFIANTNILTNSLTIASGGGLANRAGTLVVSNAANFATAGSIIFNNDDTPTTNIIISNNYPSLTGNLTIQVGGGNTNVGAVTFSGVVSGANTNTLSKTGSGTLIFAGTNTYSGGTVVAEGTLTLSGSGTLGATNGNVTITAGTVNLGGLSRTNGAFTLDSGTLTNGTLSATSFALTNAGTVSAVLAGSGALTKSGTGTATLSGANTYTGGTTVNAGALALSGSGRLGATNGNVSIGAGTVDLGGLIRTNGAFTLDSGTLTNGTLTATSFALTNAGTVSAVLAGSGALTKSGAGNATLSGANTFSGGTTVNDGTLTLSGSGTLGATNGNVSIGAGTVDLGGLSRTNGAFTLDSGSLTNGTLTASSFGLTNAGTVSAVLAGSGALTKSGPGTNTLSGSNTFAGSTIITSGALNIQNNSALGGAGAGTTVNDGAALQLQGGITVTGEALSLSGVGVNSDGALRNISGTNTYAGVITLSSTITNRVFIFSDAGLLTLNTGTITGSGLSLRTGGIGDMAISSVIGTGTGGLTKGGVGTLTLSGANTYSGGTTVNNGTLTLSGLGTLGATNGALTILGAGRVDLGGLTRTNGPFTLDSGTLSNGTFTATSFALTNAGTVSAVLAGSGALTKSGAGTATLSGANTYTGGTLISGGALQIGNGGTTGSLAGAITNNASLIFNRSDNLTQSNAITGTGNLTKTGAGTLTLLSGASYSGGTLVSAGGLQGSTASLQGIITNNGTVIFDQDTNGSYADVLSGSGSVNKAGSGTVTFTSDNSYTGETWIQLGTLNLNAAAGAAKNTTSARVSTNATLLISQSNQVNNIATTVTLSGGTIRTAAGVTETFGNLTLSSASFLDFGATFGNASSMSFGTYTPSALLTINNFDYGSTLTFGSDLTSTINNSSFFTFSNGGIASSSWDGTTFTITAIPEPSTYLAAAGLLGLMLWPSRKRLLKDAQKILGLRAPMRDRLAALHAD